MATHYTITKVRNEIRFTRNDGKYWYINVDDMRFYGLRGKPISTIPTEVNDDIYDIITSNFEGYHGFKALVTIFYYGRSASLAKIVEKLINATGAWNYTDSAYNSDAYNYAGTGYADKQYINALRIYIAKNGINARWTIETLNKIILEEITFSEDGEFSKEIKQYGKDNVIKAYNFFVSDNYSACDDDTHKRIVSVCNWLFGADSLYEAIDSGILQDYKIRNCMKQVFRWCNDMDVSIPKKDFIHQYGKLKKMHTTWENRDKQIAFQQVQSLITPYENDDFVALVPTTIDELIQEGQDQHNCVGDYWLRNYGNSDNYFNRGMYFVRFKHNPSKSYITCDFDRRTGRIMQYYKACNDSVYEPKELAFKTELEQHIIKCLAKANEVSNNIY